MRKSFKTSTLPSVFKAMAFLATVACGDFFIGQLLKTQYYKQTHGEDYATMFSMKETNAETLILGSSRAANIFNPEIINDELKKTCFNAGRAGQSVFYHYAVLKSVLKRYHPQTVILAVDACDFAMGKEDYDRIGQLLPYYEEHPEIRNIITLRSPFEGLKMLSSTYPYNSMVLPIIKNNIKKAPPLSETNGYTPLHNKIKGPVPSFDFTKYSNLDEEKINAYKSIITDCINADIQLYIVCPPYIITEAAKDKSIKLAKKIAEENRIDFFDYSNHGNYVERADYFADFKHLNNSGSQIFSKEVAKNIRETLTDSH